MASYDDFYERVAERIKSTPKNVEKCCNAIVDEIATELFTRRRAYIPYLGTFFATDVPEQYIKRKVSGDWQVYKVPEHILPKFNPCDDFVNHSNYAGVTKRYRQRAKHKALTKRDVQYITKEETARRLAQMDKVDLEKAKSDFAEILAQTKENHYDVITHNDKEDEE